MLYMIIEHFREGDPVPVYRRFRDQGRMAPDGRLDDRRNATLTSR